MKSNNTSSFVKSTTIDSGERNQLKLPYVELTKMIGCLEQIHDSQDETARFLETVAMTIKAFGMVNTSASGDVIALCDLILNHEWDLRTSANMILQIKNQLISHGNVVLDDELDDLLGKLETPVKKASKRRAKLN
jgi:hypothetical protein